MSTPNQVDMVSVDDYLAGQQKSDHKSEFSAGCEYALAAESREHDQIAENFYKALQANLDGVACRLFKFGTLLRVRFPTLTRFYYPDAMLVLHPNSADEPFEDRPVLLAEVVSDATRRIDEQEKRGAYQTIPSLDVYLMIEVDQTRVVVHRRTANGFASELFEGLGASVPLESIDAELPLARLYGGV